MTEDDVILCIGKYGNVDVDRLRPRITALLDEMRELHIDTVPLITGSASEVYVLKHYLEVLPPTKARSRIAHHLRNTLSFFGLLGKRTWHY